MAATPEDPNAGLILLVISIVLTVFAVASTAFRLFIRYTRTSTGWDDYLIAATACLIIGRTIIQIVSVPRGNGKHRWQLSEKDVAYVNFCNWMTQLFLFPILALLKSSICLLVVRIKNEKRLRYFLYGVIVGLVLTNGLPWIILLAECRPVDAYWKQNSEQCWPSKVRIYSIYLQTAYSVTTDLLCSLLPLYVVWNLQMSTLRKFGIWGLMSLGLISTAFALLRASTLGTNTTDISFDYCWTAIWADIEAYLGIVAANLALSRMYHAWFREKILKLRGLDTTSPGSVEAGPYQLSHYDGTKSSHSMQVRGRVSASRTDSQAPSEESQMPFGIAREEEYCVADDFKQDERGDSQSEGREEGYPAHRMVSLRDEQG